MTFKTKLTLTLALAGLISLAYILPTISYELMLFVRFFLLLSGIALIGLLVVTGMIANEKRLTEKANRLQSEIGARVIDTQHGTWFVSHKDIDVVPLHATPYLRINGHERDLTPDERFYLLSQAPHGREVSSQLVIEAPKPPLDLLSIFTQPTQSYAIIGGQQVGKTYQARYIASYWQQQGIQPFVIGPKWDKGEWAGCNLYGGEYDFERVAEGMQSIRSEAQSRHSDKNLTHKEHLILPVFFDDWTAIRAKLEKDAEAFIIDATTLYASVNIILYFIIHLDTANAWGVGRVGAALHQNFIKLRIEPGFDDNGLIDRSKNQGWLIMPGQSKRDWRQVRLFGGSQVLLPLPVQPTDEESRIISLVQQGLPYKEITESVWGTGKYGKFYNDKIDKILASSTSRIF